jgi:hypothetical protein
MCSEKKQQSSTALPSDLSRLIYIIEWGGFSSGIDCSKLNLILSGIFT